MKTQTTNNLYILYDWLKGCDDFNKENEDNALSSIDNVKEAITNIIDFYGQEEGYEHEFNGKYYLFKRPTEANLTKLAKAILKESTKEWDGKLIQDAPNF